MKLPNELWWALALLVGVALIGIVGGLFYAGWNLRDVFIDNPTRVGTWLILAGEVVGIYLLWMTRPWRDRL